MDVQLNDPRCAAFVGQGKRFAKQAADSGVRVRRAALRIEEGPNAGTYIIEGFASSLVRILFLPLGQLFFIKPIGDLSWEIWEFDELTGAIALRLTFDGVEQPATTSMEPGLNGTIIITFVTGLATSYYRFDPINNTTLPLVVWETEDVPHRVKYHPATGQEWYIMPNMTLRTATANVEEGTVSIINLTTSVALVDLTSRGVDFDILQVSCLYDGIGVLTSATLPQEVDGYAGPGIFAFTSINNGYVQRWGVSSSIDGREYGDPDGVGVSYIDVNFSPLQLGSGAEALQLGFIEDKAKVRGGTIELLTKLSQYVDDAGTIEPAPVGILGFKLTEDNGALFTQNQSITAAAQLPDIVSLELGPENSAKGFKYSTTWSYNDVALGKEGGMFAVSTSAGVGVYSLLLSGAATGAASKRVDYSAGTRLISSPDGVKFIAWGEQAELRYSSDATLAPIEYDPEILAEFTAGSWVAVPPVTTTIVEPVGGSINDSIRERFMTGLDVTCRRPPATAPASVTIGKVYPAPSSPYGIYWSFPIGGNPPSADQAHYPLQQMWSSAQKLEGKEECNRGYAVKEDFKTGETAEINYAGGSTTIDYGVPSKFDVGICETSTGDLFYLNAAVATSQVAGGIESDAGDDAISVLEMTSPDLDDDMNSGRTQVARMPFDIELFSSGSFGNYSIYNVLSAFTEVSTFGGISEAEKEAAGVQGAIVLEKNDADCNGFDIGTSDKCSESTAQFGGLGLEADLACVGGSGTWVTDPENAGREYVVYDRDVGTSDAYNSLLAGASEEGVIGSLLPCKEGYAASVDCPPEDPEDKTCGAPTLSITTDLASCADLFWGAKKVIVETSFGFPEVSCPTITFEIDSTVVKPAGGVIVTYGVVGLTPTCEGSLITATIPVAPCTEPATVHVSTQNPIWIIDASCTYNNICAKSCLGGYGFTTATTFYSCEEQTKCVTQWSAHECLFIACLGLPQGCNLELSGLLQSCQLNTVLVNDGGKCTYEAADPGCSLCATGEPPCDPSHAVSSIKYIADCP